jgi:tRNA A-37 threonylcarbamoyl transferase component Bud32
MHILCPGCHNPIEMAALSAHAEIACPACGSAFHPADHLAPTAAAPTTPALASGEARPAVPDYEIVRELGRGGMGVVYEARQIKLGRIVALKMILSGERAAPEELARFRREAVAVARLRHPNIVQIHAIGDYEGRPFFSLEFVEGGTLSAKLRAGLPSPKEAAALVEKLARAMYAVHQCNVVHRDLKPANVLLTTDGTPKITDFGLAKKVDDASGQTHTGAIMGTPSYMAPEQASGATARATLLADVYALGAILYECLTGRPPFKAATVAQTLRQVIEDDPVAPRTFDSAVPRDLETICLKCLRKDPGQRYATANDLAEDLRRLLALEPILARPVGRVERAAKWVRRHRALTAALVVFALGAMLSTVLGLVAMRRGTDLKESNLKLGQVASNLQEKEGELGQSKTELMKSRGEVTEKSEQVEKKTVQRWLEPLGLQAGTEVPLHDREVEALWELARTKEEPLRLLFVKEALQEPATVRQLSNRRAFALHAAVGLDPHRREAVERFLWEQLQADAVPRGRQTDLTLALAALGGLRAEIASHAALVITQRIGQENSPDELKPMSEALVGASTGLDSKDAALAANSLLQTMKDVKNPFALQELTPDLPAVAARLDAKDAAQIANIVAQAMRDDKNPLVFHLLAQGLLAVVNRMKPGDAANILLQTLKDARDERAWQELDGGLSAAAARMDTKDAARVVTTLLPRISEAKDALTGGVLARGLSGVAARLEARDAAEAAKTLAQDMKGTSNPAALQGLALGLSAIRLDPKDAAPVATVLAQAVRDTKDTNTVIRLALGLRAVAACLDPEAAAPLATTLCQAIKDPEKRLTVPALAEVLWAMMGRLAPKDAAPVATDLAQAIEDGTYRVDELAHQHSLPLTEARDAALVATRVAPAVRNAKDTHNLVRLAESLSALAASMNAQEGATLTAPAATLLVQAMKNAKAPSELLLLADGLSALAARMDAKQAATVLAPATAFLIQAIKDAPNPDPLRPLAPNPLLMLARALPALATGLEGKEAAEATTLLIRRLKDTGDSRNLTTTLALAEVLPAVASHLEPKDAAPIASALIQAILSTKDPNLLQAYGRVLSAVAARLDPQDAAKSANTILPAIRDTKEIFVLEALGQGLLAVADHLDPRNAAQITDTLVQTIKDEKNLFATQQMTQGLSAVAARLAARDAALVVAPLIQAIKDTKVPAVRSALAAGLPAVAACLAPRDGSLVLVQFLADTEDESIVPQLGLGLSAVATRGESKDAAHVAVILVRARCQAKTPAARRQLTACLLAVLTRDAQLSLPIHPPPVSEPPPPAPPPLPAQDLIDLLKNPFCVGEARRMVLDQLQRHCNRPFADQWDFVRVAEENRLLLDLRTPPQRTPLSAAGN